MNAQPPRAARRRLTPALSIALAGLAAAACDGTLTGMHATRGVLPTIYAEPLPSAAPDRPSMNEPTSIAAQHMLVMHRESRSAPPTVVRTKAEARARAEEAQQKIRDGAPVDEIFGRYSDEPGAAQREPPGSLGTFSRKSMVKRFSDAAFKLQVGEISEIIETEFGFHIIRRLE